MKYKLLYLLLSFIFTFIICEWKGDQLEEYVRTTLYKVKHDSIPVYSKEFTDDKGIPYVMYYPLNGIEAGKQYNQTIVANYAIDYYKQFNEEQNADKREQFKNCVDWLSDTINHVNGFALYQFTWQQPWFDSVKTPYTSGMTSGRAIEAMSYAYQLFGDRNYLNKAFELLRGFYLPVDSGGFTFKEPNGWWYEELADTNLHTPRILDGHIFAITGVFELWKISKNDSAKTVFTKGLESLKYHLPEYQYGNNWSCYNKYKQPTDKKYHKILTAQMKQLWEITGDEFFFQYYKKWDKPLSRPFVLRVMYEFNRSGIILVITLWLFLFWMILLIHKRLIKLL